MSRIEANPGAAAFAMPDPQPAIIQPAPVQEEQKTVVHKPIDFSQADYDIDPECSICFYLMVQPSVLPCKHAFCVGCAKLCLEKAKWECPVCKHVPPKDIKFEVSEAMAAKLQMKADPAAWLERQKELGIAPKEEEKKIELPQVKRPRYKRLGNHQN